MNKKKGVVEGWGINDSPYPVSQYKLINGKNKAFWWCPIYKDWKAMIVRAHSKTNAKTRATYKGVSVCEEWKYFTNFREWVLNVQPNKDWENCALDKDILLEGNKHYSPETCVYVSQMVNNFIKDNASTRGQFLLGVSKKSTDRKYSSKCRNPFDRASTFTSYHDTEIEAHLAWKCKKYELACALADIQSDPRVAKALVSRYV